MKPVPQFIRRSVQGFLLAAALSPVTLRAQLEPGDLVAICGDSITEQRLYSCFMQEYLLMCQPAKNLNAMQFGWGGEKAGGMATRFANDVQPFKPTVATSCYGMNDGGYKPVEQSTLEEYRKQTTSFVQQMKAAGIRFILVGSPGVVDTASYKRPACPAEEYNQTLKALSGVAKEVAAAEGVTYVDVFTPMMEGMTKGQEKLGMNYKIAGDGVHPTSNGHLAMAYAFLKGMGCDGEIGTITLDFEKNKAQCDSAQKIISVSNGAIDVESTRYPYCFTGKEGETGTKAMSAFIPFNQDLNRYLLIVKNAPAKAKITWGTESREYTKAELEAGINLAADFTDHPFKEPFAKVSAEIRKQQDFEVQGIKSLLHSLINWEKLFPEETNNVASMRQLILKKDAEFRAASKAAVVPVKHSIKIEPVS